nr:MAG TPA: hypothetical protein [Caudoviricetes sp.]
MTNKKKRALRPSFFIAGRFVLLFGRFFLFFLCP